LIGPLDVLPHLTREDVRQYWTTAGDLVVSLKNTAFTFLSLFAVVYCVSLFTGLLHAQSGGGAARVKLTRNVTAASTPSANMQPTFTWPNKSKCLLLHIFLTLSFSIASLSNLSLGRNQYLLGMQPMQKQPFFSFSSFISLSSLRLPSHISILSICLSIYLSIYLSSCFSQFGAQGTREILRFTSVS
jgi:hypothetical protein